MTTEKAVAHHWRKFKERYGLVGSKCESCKHYFYPTSIICPKCRRKGKVKEYKFSGKGQVFSHTTIRVAPEGFESYIPYVVAIVELEEGAKVVSQVVDRSPEDVGIGMPVEVCFRKIREEGKSGLVLYGFKFRPVK
ncbi:MAG: Zn-ribbon domain-containing OB-fold protein [Candidatus Aenigmatarchaeota archaeon]|nr:MAG: Zn-ribbon domain-containing OB-fold protein [Candidatus Aenigmarchaeota archaeon]